MHEQKKASFPPVDGALVEVILTNDGTGHYDATAHVVTSGFGAPPEDTTTPLAEGLTCANTFGADHALTDVMCDRDTRPVDGPRYQVTFRRDTAGAYTGRFILTPSGFGGESTTPQVTELGDRLALSIVGP